MLSDLLRRCRYFWEFHHYLTLDLRSTRIGHGSITKPAPHRWLRVKCFTTGRTQDFRHEPHPPSTGQN